MSVPWGRSNARLLVCIQLGEHKQPSIVRDGRLFNVSRHCVPGYYQMSLRDINAPSESACIIRAKVPAKRIDDSHSLEKTTGTRMRLMIGPRPAALGLAPLLRRPAAP